MKNKATLRIKSVSLLLAIVVLLSAFTVLTVLASDNNGYYKTIASLDFEKANPVTSKVENVSVTTLSNGSTGYLYANPATNSKITIVPISGMKQGEKYTYMVDFYVLDYSNDKNGIFAKIGLSNMGEGSPLIEAYPGKDSYNLNQWYTYSKEITYNANLDSWNDIYAFAEARIIFDNVRVVDANGNVIFIEDFETETRTLTEGFSYIHDYSNGSVNADDKVLKLSNSSAGVVTGTIGEFALGAAGTTTNYTLSYDYLIIQKGNNAKDPDFAFKYSSYCNTCKGDDSFNHKPIGDKEHYIGSNKEVNKWYSDTMNFHFDEKCDNTYAEIYLFPGAVVIFDNIVVKDENGNVIKEYKMDSATVTGGIGRGKFDNNNGDIGTIEFMPKNQLLWCKGTPNLVDGHLYVDTTDLLAEKKYVDIHFDLSEDVAASSYPYVSYEYRILEGTKISKGQLATAVSFNGSTATNNLQYHNLNGYTVGEWDTLDVSDEIEYKIPTHFNGVAMTAGSDNFIRFYVYKGVKIEIDNIKVHNGNGVVIANINFADNGTFEEASEEAIVIEEQGLYINTKGASNEQWFDLKYLNVPDYSQLAKGSYKVEFDVYPMSLGSNVFHYRTSSPSGQETAGWWGTNLTLNDWQSTSSSFTVNDSAKTGNHLLIVYPEFEGYIDNLRILDANGNEVAGTHTDFDGLTVPEGDYKKYLTLTTDLPVSSDYAFYIDNSASTTAKEIWLHEYDDTTLWNSAKNIPTGSNYTFEFDVYTISKGTFQYEPIDHNGGSFKVAGESLKYNLDDSVVGKWVTVSLTGTTTRVAGLHKYVFGAGFKGYVDNFRVSITEGSNLFNIGLSASDLSKNNIVLMPNDITAAKNPPVVIGDTYEIKYVADNEGLKTYGSNGVLHIATDKWMGYTLSKATIGADILAGKKYRLSFDYSIITPGSNTSEWSIAMVKVKPDGDNNDYVTTATPVSGSKSYEFTCSSNNNVYLAVNVGCEVVIDNIVLEEFVNYPVLGVMKRESATEEGKVSALAYGMALKNIDGTEYIYDANGNSVVVAQKGFVAALSNNFEGELTLDAAKNNPYIKDVKVATPAETTTISGVAHNVYTLAITDPELERSISVRTYVIDQNGNVYYGEAIVYAANQLADYEFNTWIGATVK